MSVSHCFKLSHLILLFNCYLNKRKRYCIYIYTHDIIYTIYNHYTYFVSTFDQKDPAFLCQHVFSQSSARPTSSTVRLELSGEGVREDVPFTERQIGPVSLLQLPDHTLLLALN